MMTLKKHSSLFLILFMMGSLLWVGREALSQPLMLGSHGGHASGIMHKLLPGETLSHITQKYEVDLAHLMKVNGIRETTRLKPGDLLLIPESKSVDRFLPYVPASKRWKYIVIHHTATDMGDPKGMDGVHRRRGMENGLAYHFVIGNGRKMQDGSIYVGNHPMKTA